MPIYKDATWRVGLTVDPGGYFLWEVGWTVGWSISPGFLSSIKWIRMEYFYLVVRVLHCGCSKWRLMSVCMWCEKKRSRSFPWTNIPSINDQQEHIHKHHWNRVKHELPAWFSGSICSMLYSEGLSSHFKENSIFLLVNINLPKLFGTQNG